MARTILGTLLQIIGVIFALVLLNTIANSVKMSQQTPQQRHEEQRKLYGSSVKCDQARAAHQAANRPFDYVSCVRGR